MEAPRHTSLEAQFRAAVPPQRMPPPQRLAWRVALRLLALPLVQRIFVKKNRT
ncbi:MAG: hypothetical protein IPM70_18625 [Proteobacteria bacterium]|jgi:hypothetical protein|nr:hypothetical protein [Pseudomonadota bacterium]MBK7116190.1 hypothetical protein [Pseudomonadota bacterium]MBK9253771.1 hypothetical protein [Pseudomonadota bacterium]MCC6633143.1 hypothetical protein [Gammaproteobacteria bacterium]